MAVAARRVGIRARVRARVQAVERATRSTGVGKGSIARAMERVTRRDGGRVRNFEES